MMSSPNDLFSLINNAVFDFRRHNFKRLNGL